jgi:hypothetical protein
MCRECRKSLFGADPVPTSPAELQPAGPNTNSSDEHEAAPEWEPRHPFEAIAQDRTERHVDKTPKSGHHQDEAGNRHKSPAKLSGWLVLAHDSGVVVSRYCHGPCRVDALSLSEL